MLGVEKNTLLCKQLHESDVVVLDEGSQFHKYYIEAFDRLLQDIMGNKEQHFGGKHVIIGSDFGQTLPIVEKASQATQFRMSIKRSYLWAKFQQYRLISNERCRNEEWKNTLLQIRSGDYESDDDGNIKLPTEITYCDDNAEELQDKLINFVYDGMEDNYANPEWFMDRCILCPLNESTNEMNERLIEKLPGEEIISYSADSSSGTNNFEEVPIEFLNSFDYPGFPKHALKLKQNMILMLMRNINKKQGLCNGTRLILKNIKGNVLECYNPVRREWVDIPRIRLKSDVKKVGLSWTRIQFPVQPAYAMTINKSQGQTIKGKVGVYLYKSVLVMDSYTLLYPELQILKTSR